MTAAAVEPGKVVPLTGDAFARGAAQAAGGDAEAVRSVTRARIEEARSAGRLGTEALRYLDAQRRFAEAEDAQGMAELAGIAEGFGLDHAEIFTHLHLGILQDIAKSFPIHQDGCSAWAVGDGPDGPLVVKNRDFSGSHAAIQRVFRHDGPDLGQGPMLCLGSLGSPGAYSSGMNAAGLAVVDTQVGVRHHGVGWLRYFLMTRLLATAASVADSLRLIRSVPHAGGGSLVLADREGSVVAVELASGAVATEEAPLVCRTNHFTTTALAGETLAHADSKIDASSGQRRAVLDRVLPGRAWDWRDAAALMARHDDGSEPAPLCQHGETGGTRTISGAVYCCRSRVLHACLANPCAGPWQSIPLMS